MAEGETPTRAASDSDECLHCAIMDMVEERIAAGGADPPTALGDLFLQKSSPDGSGSGSTH